jgi:hypothetical protein
MIYSSILLANSRLPSSPFSTSSTQQRNRYRYLTAWRGDSKAVRVRIISPWETVENLAAKAHHLLATMEATILLNQLEMAMLHHSSVVEAQSVVCCPVLLLFSRALYTNSLLAKEEFADDGSRRRKKRNRWGDATENKAAGLMGLPTAIMANMTSEQLEAYTLHLRIEEISQKLRIDDVVPADGDR